MYARFSGRATLEELGQALAELMRRPEYEPGMDELLDFSDASFGHLSKQDIDVIRSFMSNRPQLHNNRSVIVAGSTLDFGVGRMMGSSLDADVPVDRWVCYTLEEALAWLRPENAAHLLVELSA